MPIAVNVEAQTLGVFLQLRCTSSCSGNKTEEYNTANFVVNDLATVQLNIKDDCCESLACSILALPHRQTEHCKVKVKVSCQEVDEPFYSEWICINEWKMIGKKSACTMSIENVIITLLDINITAIKVEESMVKLYNDIDFTDFNLCADEGSVAVHRAHLAAHSDVFRAMLTHEWKETTEGRIQIKGVTLQTLQHFKEYMYLHTLPDDGLESLLLLALYYLIDELRAECVSLLSLKCKKTAENWSSLLQFATDNKISELMSGLMLMSPIKAIKKE